VKLLSLLLFARQLLNISNKTNQIERIKEKYKKRKEREKEKEKEKLNKEPAIKGVKESKY
jgi:hypothetical protein